MTTRTFRRVESTDDPVVLSAIGVVFGLTMLGLLAIVGAVVVG